VPVIVRCSYRDTLLRSPDVPSDGLVPLRKLRVPSPGRDRAFGGQKRCLAHRDVTVDGGSPGPEEGGDVDRRIAARTQHDPIVSPHALDASLAAGLIAAAVAGVGHLNLQARAWMRLDQ